MTDCTEPLPTQGIPLIPDGMDNASIRQDMAVSNEIRTFIKENQAKSVVMADRVMGAPMKKGSIIRTAQHIRNARSGRIGTDFPEK